jgi:lipoprotein-anchoring transpeptidase ErfK/SrfK
VVTVSHDERMVRVFERGQLATSYKVAVGMPDYPTPYGTFSVQTMQTDPAWNVPDSDWAGDLAGKTIPGGAPDNPLKARFIGFSGAVGFHGTSDIGSLGSAASHGCIRMTVADVKDLYERINVGTTVYVG